MTWSRICCSGFRIRRRDSMLVTMVAKVRGMWVR